MGQYQCIFNPTWKWKLFVSLSLSKWAKITNYVSIAHWIIWQTCNFSVHLFYQFLQSYLLRVCWMINSPTSFLTSKCLSYFKMQICWCLLLTFLPFFKSCLTFNIDTSVWVNLENPSISPGYSMPTMMSLFLNSQRDSSVTSALLYPQQCVLHVVSLNSLPVYPCSDHLSQTAAFWDRFHIWSSDCIVTSNMCARWSINGAVLTFSPWRKPDSMNHGKLKVSFFLWVFLDIFTSTLDLRHEAKRQLDVFMYKNQWSEVSIKWTRIC